MKIDKQKLSLIIPIDRGDGTTVYVHHSPISRETFEEYFEPLAKTYSAMYASGVDMMHAMRVASMKLKKIAMADGDWENVDPVTGKVSGVKPGLFAELHRLTVVVVPSTGMTVPYSVAVNQGFLDDDDVSEVENAIVFFTCASWMPRKNVRGVILTGAVRMWGAETSLLSPSEFLRSLPKSTVTVDSSKKTEEEELSPQSSTG